MAAVIAWVVFLVAAFSSRRVFLCCMAIAASFPALAMVPSTALGGLNVTMPFLFALGWVVRSFADRASLPRAFRIAIDPSRLGLLTCFTVLVVVEGYFLPRLFEGKVLVISMRAATEFVRPSAQNISQTLYMTLSALTAFAFAAKSNDPAMRNDYMTSLLFGGAAIVVAGFVDFITFSVGLGSVLEIFRTAAYAYLTDNVVNDSKRLVGFGTEASAYGGTCVSFASMLLLLKPAFPPQRQWMASALGWLCVAMAILSTSSTAYVAIAMLMTCLMWRRVVVLGSEGVGLRSVFVQASAAAAAVALIAAIILFRDDLVQAIYKQIDLIVLSKSETDSYAERSGWTMAAWRAFVDSGFLGVGPGSVRSSNFFVNLMASTGALGFFLFLANMTVLLLRRSEVPGEKRWLLGLKLALVPSFVGQALAGTTPDYGPGVGTVFGLIAGVDRAERRARAHPAQALPPSARVVRGQKGAMSTS